MKKIALAVLVLSAVLLVSCSEKVPTLHIYNWSDYMKPELLTRFEAENNCRVVMDNYDSNEAMYAKLKAGAAGYDLLFPSSYMVSIMHKQGMLQPVQPALIPNLKNIDPAFLKLTEDHVMDHSVPYMITLSGIGYLQSRVENIEPSWTLLDRADLAGRITLLNDAREVIGAALKFLGYSLNTLDDAQLEQARDVVIRWKKNIAKFESDQYKNGLVSGEFLLCHGYNGDVLQTMEENEDIAFLIPKEGTSIASDDMVIPKDARQVELAHTFINYMLEPQVSAENMEYVFYMAPNIEGQKLVSEEFREDPAVALTPEIVAKSEVIRDLGDDNVKYNKIWDAIKAAE